MPLGCEHCSVTDYSVSVFIPNEYFMTCPSVRLWHWQWHCVYVCQADCANKMSCMCQWWQQICCSCRQNTQSSMTLELTPSLQDTQHHNTTTHVLGVQDLTTGLVGCKMPLWWFGWSAVQETVPPNLGEYTLRGVNEVHIFFPSVFFKKRGDCPFAPHPVPTPLMST